MGKLRGVVKELEGKLAEAYTRQADMWVQRGGARRVSLGLCGQAA